MKSKRIRPHDTRNTPAMGNAFPSRILLPLLLALATFSRRAEAVDKTWNVASGNWDVGSNWSDGTVPTSADNAYVDNSGTVLAPAGVSGTAGILYVGNSTSGTMNISGGSVNDTTGYLGYSAGSNGTATVSGGTWNNSVDLWVGKSGTGTLTLTESGNVSVNGGAGTLALASSTGSSGTLNIGTGGTAGTLNAALVSGEWQSTVNFNHTGEYVFAPRIYGGMHLNKFGSGTTILTGSNHVSDTTVKSGTLQIATGTNYGGNDMTIGRTSGDNGALLISGGGIYNTDPVTLGYDAGSIGTATVSSGTWRHRYLYLGRSGTGTLNVTGGNVDSHDSGSDSVTSIGSHGTATVSGGTWRMGEITYVDGSLNVMGGSVTGSQDCSIRSNGTVTVSGGSMGGGFHLLVGDYGTGTLNVTGGSITHFHAYLGTRVGGHGMATVSGGIWSINFRFYVGSSGTGTLNVTDNGNVSVNSGAGTLTLANSAGSTGTLNLGTGGTAGTLNVTSVAAGAGTATVNFNHAGSYTFGPQMTGSLAVTKAGAGTSILTGNNTYTGTTTISAGTLEFDKQTSLYNNNTANWTANNLVVASSATAAFKVGGIGEFTSANLDTLKVLGTASAGFKNGSNLGLDTTSGDFTYNSAIGNTNGGANAIGLVKLGTNTLTLGSNNSYTGDTTVTAGILAVNGSAIMDSTKLFISGGKVQATGTETVGTLFFGVVQQTSGTWGATGSGASHIDDSHFSDSTGMVRVTTGGYSNWATANGVTGGSDGDSDNDGISNLVEYALNLNPAAADGIAGTFTANLLSFTKRPAAVTNSDVTYQIESSATLGVGTWSVVTPTTDNATTISYLLPSGSAQDFARIKITLVP